MEGSQSGKIETFYFSYFKRPQNLIYDIKNKMFNKFKNKNL